MWWWLLIIFLWCTFTLPLSLPWNWMQLLSFSFCYWKHYLFSVFVHFLGCLIFLQQYEFWMKCNSPAAERRQWCLSRPGPLRDRDRERDSLYNMYSLAASSSCIFFFRPRKLNQWRRGSAFYEQKPLKGCREDRLKRQSNKLEKMKRASSDLFTLIESVGEWGTVVVVMLRQEKPWTRLLQSALRATCMQSLFQQHLLNESLCHEIGIFYFFKLRLRTSTQLAILEKTNKHESILAQITHPKQWRFPQ